MKKQEVLEQFKQLIAIENYSEQTQGTYYSAIKLFLEHLEKLSLEKVSDKEIRDYLYLCTDERKYSYSSMKQVIASIRFLYQKVLVKPIPEALNLRLRKPSTLPTV